MGKIGENNITLSNPGDYNASTATRMVSLEKFAEILRNNETLAKTTADLRELMESGASEKTVNAAKARCMPIAQMHSVCKPTRSSENVVEVTGFMCLDIDEYDGDYSELAERMWNDAELNPCMVFRSPRGKLKVVVRSNTVDADSFTEEYGSLLLWVLDNYGIKCDSSSNDIVRNTFMSHDPDCRCAPNRLAAKCVTGCWDAEQYAKVFGKVYTAEDEKDSEEIQRRTLSIIKMLETDGDGHPVYDHATRLFIGRRGDGTAAVSVNGWAGNDLKYRINACAMALFGQDAAAAQKFVDTCFVDHGNVWGKVSGHRNYKVSRHVLRWLVRNCGFRYKLQYK